MGKIDFQLRFFTKELFVDCIKILFYASLVFLLFRYGIAHLYRRWSMDDYNYGFLIPLITIYLFWELRNKFFNEKSKPSWIGFISIVLGMLFFWIGEYGGLYFALYLGAWLVAVGILWSEVGWNKVKSIAFPIVFSLSMFPPPDFIHFNLNFKLKLISSDIGVRLLHLYGMSAYREGNIIDLGFTQLQVVDACSGLRYLFPLTIMSVLLAYFFKGSWIKKILIVTFSIPLTILTNSFRIAMTGILYEVWGPAVAQDFFHGFSGWFIFLLGLVMILFLMWVLNRFKRDIFKSNVEFAVNQIVNIEDKVNTAVPIARLSLDNQFDKEKKLLKKAATISFLKKVFAPPQFVVTLVLLGGSLAASQGIDFRETVPPARSFAEFPTRLGDWVGKRDWMEEKFIKELDFSDYTIIDYQDAAGRAINFYVAYYASQRKGESIHSPETCLPGGGWEFQQAGTVELTSKDRRGSPMRVNKALLVKGDSRQLSYFWFPQRDRVLTKAWQLKVYNFWDAILTGRTDGALVRVVTPLYPGEEIEDANRRLMAITKELVPVLNQFLPQ